MSNGLLIEDDELAALEDDELATFLESDDEARRPFRPRTGRGRGYYRPRPTGNYVTQTQMQVALAKVAKDVQTNGSAIKAVNTRLTAISQREKQESQRSRESSILPFLLMKPPKANTVKLKGDVDENLKAGTTVVTDIETPKDNLLPIILLMGMGQGTGPGGTSDNSMLLLALVLGGGL